MHGLCASKMRYRLHDEVMTPEPIRGAKPQSIQIHLQLRPLSEAVEPTVDRNMNLSFAQVRSGRFGSKHWFFVTGKAQDQDSAFGYRDTAFEVWSDVSGFFNGSNGRCAAALLAAAFRPGTSWLRTLGLLSAAWHQRTSIRHKRAVAAALPQRVFTRLRQRLRLCRIVWVQDTHCVPSTGSEHRHTVFAGELVAVPSPQSCSTGCASSDTPGPLLCNSAAAAAEPTQDEAALGWRKAAKLQVLPELAIRGSWVASAHVSGVLRHMY